MGYSLDNSGSTTIVYSTSINTKVAAYTGAHTLHVKSWGNGGAVCVADVAIVVVPDPLSKVPVDALAFKGIQAQSGWQYVNDSGTSGYAKGWMTLTKSPSIGGMSSREFASQFTNGGGERYYRTFGANTWVSNFLYDGWVYIGGSSSGISNIELDMNQVTGNGQTVIYGFQCDGWTSTWDYTVNAGSPWNPVDKWLHSSRYCNPRTWSTNAWHHVQISYSRDQYGAVTYKSVWMDGVQEDIWQTVPSSFALGWGSSLLTNFQVDGYGSSGSSTVYLGDLNVYAW
ncbi:MAG TPA: hypothetical protein VGR47_09035 [Terracidiphilus sp.]|nr:hypothetical protein [Terracidiphilus sp.]